MLERTRLGIVIAAWIAQIVGGIVGFALAPSAVFSGIDADPTMGLTLRLAVYANASMAVLVGWLLWRRRQPITLRWIAVAGVVYHLPAAVDGLLAAARISGASLQDPTFGPFVFHVVCVVFLATAAALPLTPPPPS